APDIDRESIAIRLADRSERAHVEEDSAFVDREPALAVTGATGRDRKPVLAGESDRGRHVIRVLRLEQRAGHGPEDVAEIRGPVGLDPVGPQDSAPHTRAEPVAP